LRYPQPSAYEDEIANNAQSLSARKGISGLMTDPLVREGVDPEGDPLDMPSEYVPADGGGLRYTEGKVRLDLIPFEWVWGLGQVMTTSTAKYPDRNWERGMAWTTCVGCLLRHVFKWLAGERTDAESGCHHLLHAAWNCLALVSYETRGLGTDDRPKYGFDIRAALEPQPSPAKEKTS